MDLKKDLVLVEVSVCPEAYFEQAVISEILFQKGPPTGHPTRGVVEGLEIRFPAGSSPPAST